MPRASEARLPTARSDQHSALFNEGAPGAFLAGLAQSIAASLVEQIGVSANGNVLGSSRAPERAVLCVPEAAEMLGISRALAYDLVRRGELPSIRLGRRILVPRLALERLLSEAATSESQRTIAASMRSR